MRQLQERALNFALVHVVLSRLGFLALELWLCRCSLLCEELPIRPVYRNFSTTLQDFSQVLRLCFLADQRPSIPQFPFQLLAFTSLVLGFSSETLAALLLVKDTRLACSTKHQDGPASHHGPGLCFLACRGFVVPAFGVSYCLSAAAACGVSRPSRRGLCRS